VGRRKTQLKGFKWQAEPLLVCPSLLQPCSVPPAGRNGPVLVEYIIGGTPPWNGRQKRLLLPVGVRICRPGGPRKVVGTILCPGPPPRPSSAVFVALNLFLRGCPACRGVFECHTSSLRETQGRPPGCGFYGPEIRRDIQSTCTPFCGRFRGRFVAVVHANSWGTSLCRPAEPCLWEIRQPANAKPASWFH